MRKLAHISYSGFKLFENDPELFYKQYLSDVKRVRDPQNHYMAVGSAFDAFVKADLHKRFVNDGDPMYDRDTLFEMQVEPHNRDQARRDGQEVYEQYKKHGAYADLCLDMEGCINPRFEAELKGKISVSWLEGDVMILGKPDVMYISKTGARVIHDFKVNGFYSKAPKAPNPGFLKMFPGMTMHKNAMPREHKGFKINGAAYFHTHCLEWAEQLSMYAWVLGEDVGSDYIITVDQICCNSRTRQHRIAKHAGVCTDVWQNELFRKIHRCWYACDTGHVFLNLTYEESRARCEAINAELSSTPPDDFKEMTSTRMR